MSKLNLINLAKDEISKEETQRVQGGVICYCPCVCFCDCPPEEKVLSRMTDQTGLTFDERFLMEAN